MLASLELPNAPPRTYPNQLDLADALLEDPVRALTADLCDPPPKSPDASPKRVRPTPPRRRTMAPPPKPATVLSRRAQRVIRTREAASRNRMEQRAKMLRLQDTNGRLCRQSFELRSENRRLHTQFQLLMVLKSDPALLGRVLSAVDTRPAV